VLRASQSGVVTAVRFEVGQVVAEGQPIVAIANEGEPEIVADVPEDHLAVFKTSRYQAWLASAPEQTFEVALRELSPQAAAQTRTFRARLKPVTPRPLPLGATATLVVERQVGEAPVAVIPASAITQNKGQPAVWVVRRAGGEPVATVDLINVSVHGYRNEEALVSGPPAGELVVTAGVQKMAPALRIALLGTTRGEADASGPCDEIVQPYRMGAAPSRRRALPDPGDCHRRRAGLHQARPARRPELLGAVDDGDGDLARRHGAAGPGPGTQPDGEEVRAARPLREGQDLRTPGLRRHADHGGRRHLARGSAGGVVPGAQEVQRHQARASRRRHRPVLQRRIRRRDRAAVCRQGRRRQLSGAFRRIRGHQTPPAEGADGEEDRHLRQAGEKGLRRVLAPAAGRPRHHAAGHRGEPQQPEQRTGSSGSIDTNGDRVLVRESAGSSPIWTISATCRSPPAAG
jgi:hypothetical protein